MRSLPRTLALLAATLLAQHASAQTTTHYAGTIDGKLNISMTLKADEKGTLEGTYLYTRVGQNIFLKGRQRADQITLTESDHTLKTTGNFDLRAGGANNTTLTGTWKSPDAKRTLPVSLTPIAATITLNTEKASAYTVETGILHLTKKSPFYTALNADLERQCTLWHEQKVKEMKASNIEDMQPVDHAADPYKAAADPTLLYADDTLVSIRTLLSEYTGGAHFNYNYTTTNYAWRNGKLAKLQTADLVPVTPATMTHLRDLCITDLKRQHADWPEDLKFEAKTPPDLNFTPEGLLLTFPPYAVGPFAAGTYTVSLPWPSVKPILKEDSPLKSLAN